MYKNNSSTEVKAWLQDHFDPKKNPVFIWRLTKKMTFQIIALPGKTNSIAKFINKWIINCTTRHLEY
jgi:hypothetical protein